MSLEVLQGLLRGPVARSAAVAVHGMVNASHLEGVPIGTLGSGHSVFGRNGFQRIAFAGPPDMRADFTTPHAVADLGFFVEEGEVVHALQQRPAPFSGGKRERTAIPARRVAAYAALPKAYFHFELEDPELEVAIVAYSPLIAHDLESSATPVQIFEAALANGSKHRRKLRVVLAHPGAVVAAADSARLAFPDGEVVLCAEGGGAHDAGVSSVVELEPGAVATVRFFVAWYFPEFRTPSPAATATYRRWYTRRFADALAVIQHARGAADGWSSAIDRWRDAFDVPLPMKRLWFSSLSVVATSTMLSDDPFFFAIESPHDWVNTMDVAVYANWVYLVNWPELERMDLDQYSRVVAIEGEKAGFVWHSLWSDAAHYAEEPTFVLRLWRAYLWFGQKDWLAGAYEPALAAARYAHAHDSFEHLLNSEVGNQSYDEWMMPGVSAYVNVAWLYALHALARMGEVVNREARVAERPVHELVNSVRSALLERLWTDESGGYFRCFHRTPNARDVSLAETVFSDQLFGRWVCLLDESSSRVLPSGHLVAALHTIHENNLLEDPAARFRGWVNGMLPGRQPDLVSGYHARTCWLGAQLDLAALLGAVGYEARSLDVFRSVEASLGDNHLAVGEWNRAVDASGRAVVLDEWGKDTPRFPPYPRYTSSWEYLLRMLGLTLDETYLYLQPFRSVRFGLSRVKLAGSTLSVRVEPDWSRVVVNGQTAESRVRLRRDVPEHEVLFLA